MPPCGAADDRPAATALPHQAVCVRREIFYIFVEVGPSGPRVGQKQILILPAGRILLSDRRASLVTGGRGKGDYERPLREGAHRSRPPAILSCLSDRSERHIYPYIDYVSSKKSKAATVPSLTAVVNCRTDFVRQSPAAYTPGRLVRQSEEQIYPASSSSTRSAKSWF